MTDRLDEWLEDERELADEIADAHDLRALRAKTVNEPEEEPVVIEMPRPPRTRGMMRLAPIGAALGLAAAAVVLVPLVTAEPEPEPVAPRVVAPPVVEPPTVTEPPSALEPPVTAARKISPEPKREQERPERQIIVDYAQPGGFLTLNTTPWSLVRIDGQPMGSTPLFKVRLAPGRHEVEMVTAAGVTKRRVVNIKLDKTVRLNLRLKERRERERPSLPHRVSKQDILRVVKASKEQLQACGELLEVSGSLIKVEFVVAASGRTRDARVMTRDLADHPVAECVLTIVRRYRFPEARTESPPVRIPLKL